jgi:hypothetical protein
MDGEKRTDDGGKEKVLMDMLEQNMEGALNQNNDYGKVFEVGESSGSQINEGKMTAEPDVQRESNQGSSNLGNQDACQRGKNGNKMDNSFGVAIGKNQESVFYHRCKVAGHYTKECRKVWQSDKDDGIYRKRDQNLSECVATLCATQVEGLAFFCIPNRPSLNHSKERVNTTIITMIKGSIIAKPLEEEFTRIMSGIWRWTGRKVVDNKFAIRFPDVQLIRDWAMFNHVKLRIVNAKIQIDTGNISIRAKAELQQAWF